MYPRLVSMGWIGLMPRSEPRRHFLYLEKAELLDVH
jgi:hypothetical protein